MIIHNNPTPTVDRAQLALPGWQISNELAARFATFNDDVDQVIGEAREFEESDPSVGGNAATLTIEEVHEHRHQRQDGELKVAQGLVELFEQRATLLADAIADLSATVALAEESLSAAKSKVCQQLTKLGLGVEASQAWPTSEKSAAIELDHRVAKSTIVSAAAAVHHDLTIAFKSARDLAVSTERHASTARERLSALVGLLVSGV